MHILYLQVKFSVLFYSKSKVFLISSLETSNPVQIYFFLSNKQSFWFSLVSNLLLIFFVFSLHSHPYLPFTTICPLSILNFFVLCVACLGCLCCLLLLVVFCYLLFVECFMFHLHPIRRFISQLGIFAIAELFCISLTACFLSCVVVLTLAFMCVSLGFFLLQLGSFFTIISFLSFLSCFLSPSLHSHPYLPFTTICPLSILNFFVLCVACLGCFFCCLLLLVVFCCLLFVLCFMLHFHPLGALFHN